VAGVFKALNERVGKLSRSLAHAHWCNSCLNHPGLLQLAANRFLFSLPANCPLPFLPALHSTAQQRLCEKAAADEAIQHTVTMKESSYFLLLAAIIAGSPRRVTPRESGRRNSVFATTAGGKQSSTSAAIAAGSPRPCGLVMTVKLGADESTAFGQGRYILSGCSPFITFA